MNKKLAVITAIVVVVFIVASIVFLVVFKKNSVEDDIDTGTKEIEKIVTEQNSIEDLDVNEATGEDGIENYQTTTNTELDATMKELDNLMSGLDSNSDFSDFGNLE